MPVWDETFTSFTFNLMIENCRKIKFIPTIRYMLSPIVYNNILIRVVLSNVRICTHLNFFAWEFGGDEPSRKLSESLEVSLVYCEPLGDKISLEDIVLFVIQRTIDRFYDHCIIKIINQPTSHIDYSKANHKYLNMISLTKRVRDRPAKKFIPSRPASRNDAVCPVPSR